jgi:hypothetical protein
MGSDRNSTPGDSCPDSRLSQFLCHFAFWFGLLFATPIFVAISNLGNLDISLFHIVMWAALVCVLSTLISWQLARTTGYRFAALVSRVLLAMALLLAIQGNLINDLFYYGAFNGESMQFRAYGPLFYAESLVFLVILLLAVFVLFRLKRISTWLPLLPVLSFSLLVFPPLIAAFNSSAGSKSNTSVDPAVFEFSSRGNLVHLLPDALQGDVVLELFQLHPELAEKFRGFTLYKNHLGLYQGTAASLYTIHTGEPWPLDSGYDDVRAKQGLQSKSYQRALYDQGYRLDYVPVANYVCPDFVTTCYPRSFSDLKSRGYYRHQTEDTFYGVRLIADLTLFRLMPMMIKEKIYSDGQWFLSDTAMDGSSPWPDPVVREWTQRMSVVDKAPVYKWYHYIGSHAPPHWDGQCEYHRELRMNRETFKAQAYCILQGIGQFADRLREAGIFDETAILISSDHGNNLASQDLQGLPFNGGLKKQLIGKGRPTLLVKKKNSNQPLSISESPTSLVDLASTALSLVGLPSEQKNIEDFKDVSQRDRYFTPYVISKFWTGEPISHFRYRVAGPVSEADEWQLTEMISFDQAPVSFKSADLGTSNGFIQGVDSGPAQPDMDSSWVTGKQLAFLLDLPPSPSLRSIALTMRLPPWITDQSFNVQINGIDVGTVYRLAGPTGDWQTVNIPLPINLLKPDNNFFNILFKNTKSPPDEPKWHASAILKSITVIEHP